MGGGGAPGCGDQRRPGTDGFFRNREMAAPLLGRGPGGTEATAAGRGPGQEDEFRAGGGLHGQADAARRVDEQAAVEAFAHRDPAAGVGAAMAAPGDLDEPGSEPDRVVPRDYPLVAAAQLVGEVGRRAAPDGDGVGRGLGEAGVEVGEELWQEGVRGFARGQAPEVEFGDQPVLQGAPEPLDTAFGLGRAGGDEADGQVLEEAAEVGGGLGALEFLRECPVRVVADEDTEPVAIERQGEAILRADLLEEGDIAVQILGGAEVQGQDGAGRVVDRAEQGEAGPAPLEPVKGTAVELREAAHAGLGGPAGPVLPGAAAMFGGQAEGPADPPDGGPAHQQALDLAQLL